MHGSKKQKKAILCWDRKKAKNAKQMASIPLDEFAPDASARYVVVNGKQYLSIRDVLVHVYDIPTIGEANKKWTRVSPEIKHELANSLSRFCFPGDSETSPSPVLTFPGVLQLIQLLPNPQKESHYAKMVSILSKYYKGEEPLVPNLPPPEQPKEDARSSKRKREETGDEDQNNKLKIQANEQEIKMKMQESEMRMKIQVQESEMRMKILMQESEMRMKIQAEESEQKLKQELEIRAQESEQELRTKAQNATIDLVDRCMKLCSETNPDRRTIMMFQDCYVNLAMQHSGQKKEGMPNEASRIPISITNVAQEMGVKLKYGQDREVGTIAKDLYVRKHGRDPPKDHNLVCGGRMIQPNSYYAEDRPLLEEAMRTYTAKKMNTAKKLDAFFPRKAVV